MTHLETLQAMLAAFNRHDVDAVMSFFADEATFEGARGPDPWGRRVTGKDAIREVFEARIASVPDLRYTDERHFVAENRGVSEWTTSGTESGGSTFRIRGCDLFTFDGSGQVVKKESFWKIVDA